MSQPPAAGYEFDFLNQNEDFFDDGDNLRIRAEVGEDLEGYGLVEATDEQINEAMQSQGQKPDVDGYDFRMEGRGGGHSSVANPGARPPVIPGRSQNTGPKGVKKDYEDSKRATKINRQMDEVRRERLIRQHVSGRKIYYLDQHGHVQSYKQHVDEDGRVLDSSEGPKSKLGVFNSKVDCDDEEYRKLKEARENMLENFIESVNDHQADVAGEYRRAEDIDRLSAMLKVNHPQCHAVLHLYDNENPCCQRLHMILEDFSKMFPHVLFIRARCEDVMPNYDKRFLPTFILYKDTKIVDRLIGLGPALTVNPDDDQVVKLLADKGALSFPTNGYDMPSEQERRRQFITHMNEDDDDDAWLDAEE